MAKPNYQYEKRQKDLAKKKKQEEKRLRKLGKTETEGQPGDAAQPGTEMTPADGQETKPPM